MVVLGVLLVVLSALLTVGVVASNTESTAAEAFGVSLSNVSLGGMFLAGAITGLVFGLGLAMVLAGLRRKRRKAVERREVVRETRGTAETLQEENARLAADLERERAARSRGGGSDRSTERVREEVRVERTPLRGRDGEPANRSTEDDGGRGRGLFRR